jgi:steroid 5-alpha reductase family enzyme
MENLLSLILGSGIYILAFQCLLFIVALFKKNNGVADIGWGLGFIIIAGIGSYYYIFSYSISCMFREYCGIDPAFVLLVSLVLLWGLRLTIYLLIRNWHTAEDWRYAKWRQDWGKYFYFRSFLQVFVLQGVFMLVIGSPILLSAVQSSTAPFSYSFIQVTLFSLGLALWSIGFFFQAVGDYQLFVFKKDPANKGKVMRYGVWEYTRHPNYFGESSMWWGIFLLSCVSAHSLTDVLLRLIGPSTITFMLLRVSGVTMLENKYKGNKEYEEYQKNTSSFIPMPSGKK